MAKILNSLPHDIFFVYNDKDERCIRIFKIKDKTTAFEDALTISEAKEFVSALEIAIGQCDECEVLCE